MNHPLAFQAVILSYCARWKTVIYNAENRNEIGLHMSQVSRGIESVRAGSERIDDDSLAMAFAGLALQEERFGCRDTAQRYADQGGQLLRPQNGHRSGAEVFLHYTRYMLTPPSVTIDFDSRQWLIRFLRGAEELMTDQNTDFYLSRAPERRTAFQMESPLYALLSSGPHPSQVPPQHYKYVVQSAPTQDTCRSAALIYITAVLWDLRDSPSRTRRYLAGLLAMVRQQGLDRYPACETLVWVLLEENFDVDLKDAQRAWSTGELLRMQKQLRPDLQFEFNEILTSFLVLTTPIGGIDVFERKLMNS